jgi:hypothetical protein
MVSKFPKPSRRPSSLGTKTKSLAFLENPTSPVGNATLLFVDNVPDRRVHHPQSCKLSLELPNAGSAPIISSKLKHGVPSCSEPARAHFVRRASSTERLPSFTRNPHPHERSTSEAPELVPELASLGQEREEPHTAAVVVTEKQGDARLVGGGALGVPSH